MRIWSIFLLVAGTAWAQARFEVISVKPSPADQKWRFNLIGDRLEVNAATVGDVLDMLNGFRLYRVVGGPGWMRTDRYDIVAKADRPVGEPDLKSAVMGLLAERFQLQAHTETREMPGFTIHAPKAPGVLKPAARDEKSSLRTLDGDVVFTREPITALTNYLSNVWAAPVEDETKLEGVYDFTLPTSRAERHPGDKWADRVRDALEEIGFRVEARKIPLEVTVVDRCERPSEN